MHAHTALVKWGGVVGILGHQAPCQSMMLLTELYLILWTHGEVENEGGRAELRLLKEGPKQ